VNSVFLSYASADRTAARRLRETLTNAGLDVWLDEEELAGGEAWDAKIRHQIRTCTYFMPLISATTQVRREGYFRREWRLAVERTLDFADDVLFLIPVVIDDTPDQGARVPERFTSVQWLRCRDGVETPALLALARRLAQDNLETRAPMEPAPEAPAPPPLRSRKKGSLDKVPLRPFPTFPAFPHPGKRLQFLYDLVLWFGFTATALWVRLPRGIRLLATVLIVFKLINAVFNGSDNRSHRDEEAARIATQARQTVQDTAAASAVKDRLTGLAGVALDAMQIGRPLALISFTPGDPTLTETTHTVFSRLQKQLSADGREDEIAVSLTPLATDATDIVALARANALQSQWLVTGFSHVQAADQFSLDVKLFETRTGKIVWQETRTAARTDTEAESWGKSVAAEILSRVKFE
jgi:hypothetical protein